MSDLAEKIAKYLAHEVDKWQDPDALDEFGFPHWHSYREVAEKAIEAIEGEGYRIVPPTSVTKDMSLRTRQKLDSRIHSQRRRIAWLEKEFASFAEQRSKIVRGYLPKWLGFMVKLSTKNRLLKKKIDWLSGELNWAIDSNKQADFLRRNLP